MWKCSEIVKRPRCFKINCGPFWWFHHYNDLTGRRIHSGIIVSSRRVLLLDTITLPLHQHQYLFTSALENSGLLWDFSCLTNPEMPQRVCKNPWKFLKTTSTALLFSSLLVWWSEGESRICCGQLLFVLIDLISQHSPGSGPYYLSWLWDTLFCSTCFNVASATQLCLFLVYLIVTCWNIGGDLIPEVEGHEMEETGSMVDSTSCL